MVAVLLLHDALCVSPAKLTGRESFSSSSIELATMICDNLSLRQFQFEDNLMVGLICKQSAKNCHPLVLEFCICSWSELSHLKVSR